MTAFCVHADANHAAAAHRVQADDFLDAALLFAERWLHPQGEDAVTLYVQDEASGEERCLRLDLAAGEVVPESVPPCDESEPTTPHRRAA